MKTNTMNTQKSRLAVQLERITRSSHSIQSVAAWAVTLALLSAAGPSRAASSAMDGRSNGPCLVGFAACWSLGLTSFSQSKALDTDSTAASVFADLTQATERRPPGASLWTSRADLVVDYYPQSNVGLLLPPRFRIGWSVAQGADHYRLTILKKVVHDYVVTMDTSPVTYVVDSDGRAYRNGYYFVEAGRSYLIIVTAYSGPDEAVAYSESIQARATAR